MTESFVAQLIGRWGYLAIALGALAEGETFVLAGGYAAHRGLLWAPAVFAVAAVAAFVGDQVFFWVGRLWGARVLARWPSIASKQEAVARQLRRFGPGAIVAVRFLYGFRIAGPVLIGAAEVPPLRFAFWNAIGALLWAAAITAAGWLFGQAMGAISGRLHSLETGLLVLLGSVAIGGGLWHLWRAWRQRRQR